MAAIAQPARDLQLACADASKQENDRRKAEADTYTFNSFIRLLANNLKNK